MTQMEWKKPDGELFAKGRKTVGEAYRDGLANAWINLPESTTVSNGYTRGKKVYDDKFNLTPYANSLHVEHIDAALYNAAKHGISLTDWPSGQDVIGKGTTTTTTTEGGPYGVCTYSNEKSEELRFDYFKNVEKYGSWHDIERNFQTTYDQIMDLSQGTRHGISSLLVRVVCFAALWIWGFITLYDSLYMEQYLTGVIAWMQKILGKGYVLYPLLAETDAPLWVRALWGVGALAAAVLLTMPFYFRDVDDYDSWQKLCRFENYALGGAVLFVVVTVIFYDASVEYGTPIMFYLLCLVLALPAQLRQLWIGLRTAAKFSVFNRHNRRKKQRQLYTGLIETATELYRYVRLRELWCQNIGREMPQQLDRLVDNITRRMEDAAEEVLR